MNNKGYYFKFNNTTNEKLQQIANENTGGNKTKAIELLIDNHYKLDVKNSFESIEKELVLLRKRDNEMRKSLYLANSMLQMITQNLDVSNCYPLEKSKYKTPALESAEINFGNFINNIKTKNKSKGGEV